jgi:hypothetical protein
VNPIFELLHQGIIIDLPVRDFELHRILLLVLQPMLLSEAGLDLPYLSFGLFT